jgi:hypothetical protein
VPQSELLYEIMVRRFGAIGAYWLFTKLIAISMSTSNLKAASVKQVARDWEAAHHTE